MDNLKKSINKAYDFRDVIEKLDGRRPMQDTILCPFHEDRRRSAKIYRDPDGDRLYCFCVKEGSNVYTVDRGVVAIEDIKIGEKVWSLSEKEFEPRVVVGRFRQGVKNCFRIHAGAHVLEVSSDHPVLVARKKKEERKNNRGFLKSVGYLEYVEAKNIKVGEYLVGRGKYGFGGRDDFSLGLCKLLGFWIGDGCWNHNYLQFAVVDYKEELKKGYERLGLEELAFYSNVEFHLTSGKNYFYFRGIDHKKLKEIGFDGICTTKRVPFWLWTLSKDHVLAFLKGFGDADGSISKEGRMTLCCPSEVLLAELAGLVDYLGFKRSRINKIRPKGLSKKGDEYKICYRFDINDPREIGSDSLIKIERIKNRDRSRRKSDYRHWAGKALENYPSGVELEKVKSVVEIGDFQVYDLKVEGNRNFVCEGLVVHNTENKQYQIVDYLLLKNEKVEDWNPGDVELAEDSSKSFDYSTLDDFSKGEIDMVEFCKRMVYLK